MSDAVPSPTPGKDTREIAPGVVIPGEALGFTYTLGSGPGGQNVNKRATACRLRVVIGELPLSEAQKRRVRALAGSRVTKEDELIIEASEHRTQSQNRRACLARLREMIVACLTPPKPRVATRPTRGSKERRIEAKKQRGQTKQRRQNPPSTE